MLEMAVQTGFGFKHVKGRLCAPQGHTGDDDMLYLTDFDVASACDRLML